MTSPARPPTPTTTTPTTTTPTKTKILTLPELLNARQAARIAGRRIVQCHGCFDIVHPGHIRHLRQAKSMGDILLVSITGDSRINKGKGRPLIPEELRAENLAAIDFIDWVHIDPNATAQNLLARVQPDIYVKGKEYEHNKDPRFLAEKDLVEAAGGRVVFSSGDIVFSSTALIAAMEQSVDPFHKRLANLCEMPELAGEELFGLISRFRGKRVVVTGDVILDTYVLCDRPEVAGESPIMTLRPIERRQYDGGAGILARHLAAMGARPVLVTALPDDEGGRALRQRLLLEGIEVRSVTTTTPIPEKQRFLVGSQKVMKLDLVEPMVLDAAQQRQLVDLAIEAAEGSGLDRGQADAGIIADFGLGLLSHVTVNRLCTALRPLVRVLAGDVSGKRSNLLSMHHMDLLTPSESELREGFRMFGEGLPLVTWKLLEASSSKAAIVTMGPDGLIGFERLPGVPVGETAVTDHTSAAVCGAASTQAESAPIFQTRLRGEHVPALCPMGVDPLGCGDSLLAAATLTLAAGGSLLAASFLGACAAAAQVQRLGNVPISGNDLRQLVTRVQSSHLTFAPCEHVQASGGRRMVADAANVA
ncbi:MAG: adenylyltransferase/cytidyltransferase family protein [Phycisphaerales bacterium]|nr:adenylyltransferase/cytidyltransferase family protein [Phycisphaerales bacterium]